MATTYYQTDLTKEQIEQALHAVNGVASSQNNGKVLYIDENGEIKAKSAAEWQMRLIPKTITQNGNYDPASDNADGYSSITANIPNSYTAADEGKVVSNGALVAQTARTPSITENGTYDTTGNNSVTVNVSSQAAPVLEPKTVTENGDYYPPSGVDGFSEFHVNVSGGGGSTPVIQPLNVSQNGTYPVPAGVDGFGPVVVNVSGGGGEGPIYYGTSAPASSLGSDEDLYIQYEAKPLNYDHMYEIVAQYRKVSGVWTQYTIPLPTTAGVHIWTKSTGGNDAAMYVQNGYWDYDSNSFVTTDEAESVIYTSVNSWEKAKNCYNVALLAYPSGGRWNIKASIIVTDGTNTYQPDDTVATWIWSSQKDIYIWRPVA